MTEKHALVTGASRGLGAHVATRLVEQGWAVTGVGLRPDDGTCAGRGIRYLQLDLATEGAVESLVDRAGSALDLVVHCAVRYPEPAADDLTEVFQVNAFAPYRLTRALLAAKDPAAFCSYVLVNSEAVYHADQDSGVYAASKAALRVLSTALAGECRSRNASAATLLLGSLATPDKVAQLRRVAERRGLPEDEITRLFLRKSNPGLQIDFLLDLEAAFRSVCYIEDLGAAANGMLCRLDGGSAGSLV
jgi:NAD(P)-dependent dehydrogenase (short-subunit alcohol dehydrogenase family)